jgi:hypothetical protein
LIGWLAEGLGYPTMFLVVGILAVSWPLLAMLGLADIRPAHHQFVRAHAGTSDAHSLNSSDSTHILGAMRARTRLETVTETLRHVLTTLAPLAPDWVRAHTSPDWVDRYGLRASEFRLPKGQTKRLAWAAQIGRDGLAILTARYATTTPPGLRRLPLIYTLRQVWIQNFAFVDGQLTWRDNDTTPPSGHSISSPDDTEARYATKRQTYWLGYKIHLTEAYRDDQPNLITDVETINAAVADDAVTETIHASLAEHQLLPETHGADTGYVNSTLLVSSQTTYGIDLIGPTVGITTGRPSVRLATAATVGHPPSIGSRTKVSRLNVRQQSRRRKRHSRHSPSCTKLQPEWANSDSPPISTWARTCVCGSPVRPWAVRATGIHLRSSDPDHG